MADYSHTFSSRGKLMITGEYLALYGGRVLGWPTKFRQHITVNQAPGPAGQLIWNADGHDNMPWFDALLDIHTKAEVISASDNKVADTLVNILNTALEMGASDLLRTRSQAVNTLTEWPMNWGLGSSSTLITNIAWWLNLNPFDLQRRVFGGSGYDIACALSDEPVIYQMADKPLAAKAPKPALLTLHAGFAWLGKKASTADAMDRFREKTLNRDLSKKLDTINRLTYHILNAEKIENLIKAIQIHEETIGFLLEMEPIAIREFPYFDGTVKSLGAWGGDFAMFVGRHPLEAFKEDVETKYGLRLFSAGELLV